MVFFQNMITKYILQYNTLGKKFKIKINIIIDIKRLTENILKMNDSDDIFIFTENYVAKGEYICQYRSNKGMVCGNASERPEGCYIHWKRRQQALCKQDGCVRPT